MIFYASCLILAALILLFLWMRWRMKVSKARFSLTIVSTLFMTLVVGLSAIATTPPIVIASKISEALGYGPIQNTTPFLPVVILTFLTMYLIYRFGVHAICNWHAPMRVSEYELSERYQQNNIFRLALEQSKLTLRRQKDLVASDAVQNWKEQQFNVPPTIQKNELLRDMLVSAIPEIRISNNGWRSDGEYWVGEILGPSCTEKRTAIIFICERQPTRDTLAKRIENLTFENQSLEDAKFFAIYQSSRINDVSDDTMQVGDKNVRILSSSGLNLLGLDLLNYARSIVETFENMQVGGTQVRLPDTYVELTVTKRAASSDRAPISKSLNDWLQNSTSEHIALIGEYGQGKSTALLKFCYDWAVRYIEDRIVDQRVPLLIELRGQNPSETEPLAFISQWCARYRLSPQQVMNLIKAGNAVVIFEGFDELRNAGRAFYRYEHFNSLWRFAYPGTKIIFTGRPNFFLDQEEANRTLRSQQSRKLGGDAYTTVWILEKLDRDQIKDACRSYESDVRDGIIQTMERNADFCDIVSRPSMLPVVATIWSGIEKANSENLKVSSASLIENYIQAVFSRKEAELERDRVQRDAPTGTRYLVLPRVVREMLTVCVAWRMAGLKLRNTIPRTEIVEMIRELYEPLMKIAKTNGVEASVSSGLIEFENRFSDKSLADRVEAIASEICSAGLLIPDTAGGPSNLRFPHKQFFEFLIAKGVTIHTHSPELLAADLLMKSSPDTKFSMRLLNEPNALLYLSEMIGPDLDRIIKRQFRTLAALIMVQAAASVFLEKKLFPDRFQQNERSMNYKEKILSDLDKMNLSDVQKRADPILNPKYLFMFGAIFLLLAALSKTLEFPEAPTIILFSTGASVGVTLPALLFLDVEQVFLSTRYLRVMWMKADLFPESRSQALQLSVHSLITGKVHFPKPIIFQENRDIFLYPAKEFSELRE